MATQYFLMVSWPRADLVRNCLLQTKATSIRKTHKGIGMNGPAPGGYKRRILPAMGKARLNPQQRQIRPLLLQSSTQRLRFCNRPNPTILSECVCRTLLRRQKEVA